MIELSNDIWIDRVNL